MNPVKRASGVIFRCPACGYEGEDGKKINIVGRVGSAGAEVRIVESKVTLSLPTVMKVCPKCENSRAYYQMVQTRSADEPPTRIYTCTRCGYSWREFS